MAAPARSPARQVAPAACATWQEASSLERPPRSRELTALDLVRGFSGVCVTEVFPEVTRAARVDARRVAPGGHPKERERVPRWPLRARRRRARAARACAGRCGGHRGRRGRNRLRCGFRSSARSRRGRSRGRRKTSSRPRDSSAAGRRRPRRLPPSAPR